MTTLLPREAPAAHSPVADLSSPTPRPALAWRARLRRKLVILDCFAAVTAALATVAIRYEGGPAALSGIDYRWLALAAGPLWVVVLAVSGAYESRVVGAGSEEFRRVANAGVRMLASVVVLGFLVKVEASRTVVIASTVAACILTVVLRWIARRVLHAERRRGRCAHRVLVVGEASDVGPLVDALHRVPHAGLSVVAVHRPSEDTAETVAAALRAGADTVAIAGTTGLGDRGLRRLAWSLEGSGLDLLVAPGLTDVSGPRVAIRPVDGVPLLQVDQPAFTGWRRVVKTAVDRLFALTALLVLAVPLGLLAVAVRLTSSGPAFFRQVRVGQHGRTFRIWKLRTMVVDADSLAVSGNDATGLLFKLHTDPRVTPLGRVLRRWSLDELPQLLNVLTGSMSLVGPRPPLPSEVEGYGEDVRRRLLVKPGLTGLWQVSGRSDLPWEECVRLDLMYVENWSVTLDLVILARTVAAVARGRGAY